MLSLKWYWNLLSIFFSDYFSFFLGFLFFVVYLLESRLRDEKASIIAVPSWGLQF